VVPLAYVAALLCGAAILTFGLFNGQITGETMPVAIGTFIGVTLYGGMVSFVPALVAILIAEFLAWRSIFYYLAAGGVVGAIAWHLTTAWDGLDFADHLLALCLAAGFVAGFVYWLAAGRDAGPAPAGPASPAGNTR
jgi:hypothetical protein